MDTERTHSRVIAQMAAMPAPEQVAARLEALTAG